MVRYIVIFATLFCVAGCVSSSETYTSDGKPGYKVSCHGALYSWATCHAKAGDICGARGYTVDNNSPNVRNSRDADIVVADEDDGVIRSMVVSCN